MPSVVPLADPCALCGAAEGERRDGWLRCVHCRWRVGDVIDPDLERPRVEVVYYLRYADRIKIGTSSRPRQRLAAIWHDELLAFELGGRALERQRHREFAGLREGGEWFRARPALVSHIAALECPTRGGPTPAGWATHSGGSRESIVVVRRLSGPSPRRYDAGRQRTTRPMG